jgi:hypothetical protein
MKIQVLAITLLACSGLCSAQSVLVGKKLISDGDNIGKVREAVGSPDKVDKIPGDASSPPMEIWTYKRKESVITIFVVDSKVVHSQEKPATNAVVGTDGPGGPSASGGR